MASGATRTKAAIWLTTRGMMVDTATAMALPARIKTTPMAHRRRSPRRSSPRTPALRATAKKADSTIQAMTSPVRYTTAMMPPMSNRCRATVQMVLGDT